LNLNTSLLSESHLMSYAKKLHPRQRYMTGDNQ
jgi:hypothetical protein